MKHLFTKLSFLLITLLSSCDNTYVPKGTFTNLSEIAYLFTQDELINIAYINNGGGVYDADGNRMSIDKSTLVDVEPLDSKTELTIRKDYYNSIKDTKRKDDYIHQDDPFSDIKISDYCGYYHGYYVLRFYDVGDYFAVIGTETIANLMFVYPYEGGNKLVGWKKN